MKFEIKFSLIVFISIVVLIFGIVGTSYFPSLLSLFIYSNHSNYVSLGITLVSNNSISFMKENPYSKIVKLTDEDLAHVPFLNELVDNVSNQFNQEYNLPTQNWNDYVNWIREKYHQQFDEKLENSHNVFYDYHGKIYLIKKI